MRQPWVPLREACFASFSIFLNHNKKQSIGIPPMWGVYTLFRFIARDVTRACVGYIVCLRRELLAYQFLHALPVRFMLRYENWLG